MLRIATITPTITGTATWPRIALLAWTLIMAPTLAGHLARGQDAPPSHLFFQQVRIFDGEKCLPATNLTVKDGLIVAVGQDLVPDAEAVMISGDGNTLLPGLIDCHVHAFSAEHLRQAAIFGVTTELDMMSVPQWMSVFRREQASGKANDRADVYSAGEAVTVKGGHGTQFGFEVPTLDSADEAEAFVAARVGEGSDYIKIILEDGSAYGISFKTLSPEMLKRSIAAAHGHQKLAVAHVSSHQAAEDALNAGIDGIVHLFADQAIAQPLLDLFVGKKTFVVPTMTVVCGVCGPSLADDYLNDPHLIEFLTVGNIANLKRSFPSRTMPSRVDYLMANLKALHEAGVPILAGTDAPNPGTVHGASMHVELELLVTEGGLAPVEALAAATSVPAQHFRLNDRGRIAPGLRADLLLVKGRPDEDIRATRNIVGVWKAGVAVDREPRRRKSPPKNWLRPNRRQSN